MFWRHVKLACLLIASGALVGCPAPPGVSDPTGSAGSSPGADALEQVAYSIMVARVEDHRRVNGTTKPLRRAQGILDLFNGPCFNGGERSTAPDGTMTFDGCEIFPGVELNGGVRVIPSPNGQGGRIEFLDLRGTKDGNDFRVDGSIEEREDADGGLTFEFDLRSSTDDGEYNDQYNVNGAIHVTPEAEVFGDLRTDTGDAFDFQRPSNCRFDGQDLLGLLDDPDAFARLCPDEEFGPLASGAVDLPDDPAGLDLAAQILAEIGPDERATAVLGPSPHLPNTLFGLAFEHARAFVQLDAVGLDVVGVSVEDVNGRHLYTLKSRYRGFTLTLGTGDRLAMELTEGGALTADFLLNSTRPPSTIAVRIGPDGEALLNETRTQVFTDPNPDYGLKSPGPPAKALQRAAGIRLERDDCVGLLGTVRSGGSALCDLKDVFTGELLERVPETLCVLSKRALAQGPITDKQELGAINLSLTVWCTTVKGLGLGARFFSKLTPAEIGCKVLTIGTEAIQTGTGEDPEDLVCGVVTRGNWFENRVEVIGFVNADGSTEDTGGATADARVVPFGPDPAHPTFEWAPHLVPQAEQVIVSAESEGGAQELYYWLARGEQSISQPVTYGHYNRGERGVSNVPYPAPPLLILPDGWFYRLRIDLIDGTTIQTRFRMVDPGTTALRGNIGEMVRTEPGFFGDRVVTSPVVGASVQVLTPDGDLITDGETDEDGDYYIGGLELDTTFLVRVEKNGYAKVQRKIKTRLSGETTLNVRIPPQNPNCGSDLGLIKPITGPVAREKFQEVLDSPIGEGVDPSGLLICVTGTRTNVVVNWNPAWVADHMRAVDADHVGDYSDAELKPTAVALRDPVTRESIIRSFGYVDFDPPIELKFKTQEGEPAKPVLVPGQEYILHLEVFIGDLVVITSEPRLRFIAR